MPALITTTTSGKTRDSVVYIKPGSGRAKTMPARGRRRSTPAHVELWNTAWRYRVELVPYGLAGAVWTLTRVGEEQAVWPVLPAAVCLGAAGAVWRYGDRLRLDRSGPRRYAAAVLATTGGWSAYALTAGLTGHAFLALTALATVAAVPWWRYRAIRSKVALDMADLTAAQRRRAIARATKLVRDWEAVALAAKVPGSRLQRITADAWSMTLTIVLRSGSTADELGNLRRLESALDAAPRSARIEEDNRNARRIKVRVMLADPHARPVPFPGPSITTVKDPLDLGPYEDNSPARLRIHHTLIAGMSDSGKSGGLNVIVYNLVAAADVAMVGIDLKYGLELGPWTDTFLATATNVRQAVKLLHGVVDVMDVRGPALKAAGKRKWEPTPEAPYLAVIVDELAALTRVSDEAMELMEDIAARGRALGVYLVMATQYPLATVVSSILRGQCGNKLVYALERSKHVDVVLGDGMSKTWKAHEIPDTRQGSFYLRARGAKNPKLARTYWLDDHTIEQAAATYATRRTRLDEPSALALAAAMARPDNTAPASADIVDAEVIEDTDRPAIGAHEPDNDDAETILAALAEAPDEGATAAHLIKATGLSKPTLYRRLAELRDAGQIANRNRRWTLADLTDSEDSNV